MIDILAEEATARHCPYSNMLSQPLAEVQVILYAVLRDIEQHVIGSLRIGESKSELAQAVTEELLHVGVVCLKLIVIVVGEAQSYGGSLHQRSRCANSQEIMYLLHTIDNALRSDDITQTPTRDAVGLRE